MSLFYLKSTEIKKFQGQEKSSLMYIQAQIHGYHIYIIDSWLMCRPKRRPIQYIKIFFSLERKTYSKSQVTMQNVTFESIDLPAVHQSFCEQTLHCLSYIPSFLSLYLHGFFYYHAVSCKLIKERTKLLYHESLIHEHYFVIQKWRASTRQERLRQH